jgi:two-component system chemotaxis sensor kinase CheA
MNSENNINNIKNTYFIESRELLNSMESSLLTLENNKTDRESINSVFRAVHTIKGNSGMFGFDVVGDFAHVLENILDNMRKEDIDISDEMISLFLESHDYLQVLIDQYEQNEEEPINDDLNEMFIALKDKLDKHRNINNNEIGNEISLRHDNDFIDNDDTIKVKNQCWHISLRFHDDVFKDGLDPMSFIGFLQEKGNIINIKTLYDNMPMGKEMIPETCYLGFEIDFKSQISKKEIEDIFDFVQDDCDIRILPPESNISEYVKLIKELPEKSMRIGEMLCEVGSLTETELKHVLNLQKKSEQFSNELQQLPVGAIMVEEKLIQNDIVDAALEKQQTVKKRDDINKRLIRIDAEKLDNLINLIGELVIIGSNVKQISETDEKTGLVKAVTDMSKLIEEIRDSTMGIRMVQIGETFNRFERVVRDLSKEKGKKIVLTINGGETELDKTLVDKISDPLIHLIRNAVDHGIDYPEERKKIGKPETGNIVLNAYHETGSIVIEVIDDGSGLDRDKIFSKAVELELIKNDTTISDYELFQFIFEPGFSTAKEVTNISGRGVGMDVVKRSIESIRGMVFLESKAGIGTSIRIQMPLTLAIIDGFMVKVEASFYVLPLDMVVECTEVLKEELDSKDGGNFINLRGDVLPFIRLREFFDETGEEPQKPKIVVVEYSRKKAGLVVDDLIGEFQTVIKPLGKIFNKLQWISGSTILGTGEVAYILDIPKLIQNVQMYETSKFAHKR